MNKGFCLVLSFVFSYYFTQDISKKLDIATKELLQTPEMISANLSFYVANGKGQKVYEYQGDKGLSTASTQKLFTSAAALEILTSDYQYSTKLYYTEKGDLVLFSEGDPTLGSWRYEETKPEKIKRSMIQAIKSFKINKIEGDLIIDDSYFDFQTIPGGWPWNDIGNYYGAGVWGVNWRENQFDVNILGGKFVNDFTQIKSFSYPLKDIRWLNETISHKEGGDKSIIYTAPHSEVAYISGSLPIGKITTISGSVPNPPLQFGVEIVEWLKESEIEFTGKIITASQELINRGHFRASQGKEIWHHKSPKMGNIIYWFMKKSINLYGEAIVKTLGKITNNNSNFDNGVKILKDFWKERGIHPAMINFVDGSGLSPQNYASSKAEVQALIWAKNQKWYPVLEKSFPIYNQMKMKSGTIKNAKAYVGEHTATNGKSYIFSVIINNYYGKNVNDRLFKLLNILK